MKRIVVGFVLTLFLTSLLIMMFYAAPVTARPSPGPGPSAEITVLDPYNEIPVGDYGTFDVLMDNTGDQGVPQDVLWYVTLTAVASNNLVEVMLDADVTVYYSDGTIKWSGTVSGTTETIKYAPWSTTVSFSAVTWTLPETVTLDGGEYLIITIELHCLDEGSTIIDVFPRATEDHHNGGQPVGSISDKRNLYQYKDGLWYPLHNSYDPYDDPIPGVHPVVSNGHSFKQHSWEPVPTIHRYAKGTKTVIQGPAPPPEECTVDFYTDPVGVDYYIIFEGQTYHDGDSDTFWYGTSSSATAYAPAGWILDHWETTGNVGVSSTTANPTTVTITCGGTLKAVYKEVPPPPPPALHLDAEPPILIDLTNPVSTVWHELYPTYCNWYHLSGWFDSNGNGVLDHCDYIVLGDVATGTLGWYHVEDVTVTILVTKKPDLIDSMYIEFDGDIWGFPFTGPIGTMWHEVYPDYCNWYTLTSWEDTDLSGDLNPSDQIDMTPLEGPTEWYHVDEVKTDILVTLEKHPDFGDAPDPLAATPGKYPSLLADNGALHMDWNYEWLGASVNGELDSKQVDLDEFDDGVSFVGSNLVVPGGNLQLTITISTSGGPYNIADPNDVIYLNAWIDWNGDGDWEDAGEKIIGTGSPTGTQKFAGPATPVYNVPIPASATPGDTWLRFRLDYAEDAGSNPQPWTDPSLNQEKGQAMFGEVEDYWITIEEAPEPPVACFSVSNDHPNVCETVTFDASASTPDGGVIISWDWDFGDTTTGAGEIVTHHYDACGDYKVTLIVTDSEDKSDTITKTIHVSAPPPPPVGGVWVPINKFELLTPWIGLASFTVISTIVVSLVHLKRRKKKLQN